MPFLLITNIVVKYVCNKTIVFSPSVEFEKVFLHTHTSQFSFCIFCVLLFFVTLSFKICKLLLEQGPYLLKNGFNDSV